MSSPTPFPTKPDEILFTPAGDGYAMAVQPHGIAFAAHRLKRDRQGELSGELVVRVPPAQFEHAKTADGVLSSTSFNFSSAMMRSRHAKLLAERSGAARLDWFGYLEALAIRITEAERVGQPAEDFADMPRELEEDDSASWELPGGFPILKRLPMILYGLGGAGKSYFSMWIALQLAKREHPVVYADWEFDRKDHKQRYDRLESGIRGVKYLRCTKPLRYEIDRILAVAADSQAAYVIFDSIVFALGGPADEERAGEYFRAVRRLKVGSLHLAHTSKSDEEEKSVYGSVFFQNGARSIWLIHKTERNADGELVFGLFQQKNNLGGLLKPKGYKLQFRQGLTTIEPIAVDESDELAAKLPLVDRIVRALGSGPLSMSALGDAVNVAIPRLKTCLLKHQGLFRRVKAASGKDLVGLRPDDEVAF